MDVGEPLRVVIVEPIELPEPLREPQRDTPEPVREPEEEPADV